MNWTSLAAIVACLSFEPAVQAQVRRDINGIEPGYSRHMMEESLRQQQQQAERQRHFDRYAEQVEFEAQLRAQRFELSAAALANAPAPNQQEAVNQATEEQPAAIAVPGDAESNHRMMIGVGVGGMALLAIVLVFYNALRSSAANGLA